jgi:CubicO group peptidase (beta-lactamase class C family)
MHFVFRAACLGAAASLITVLFSRPAFAAREPPAPGLSPETIKKVDDAAAEVLKRSAVPGTLVAVVRGGRIVYLHAYGNARLGPRVPADPALRYAIGSISMQFTASALLLLQQDGKLEQFQVAVKE